LTSATGREDRRTLFFSRKAFEHQIATQRANATEADEVKTGIAILSNLFAFSPLKGKDCNFLTTY
jgi:hypothetical protein